MEISNSFCKIRKSSIDLLKLFAIFLICFSHAAQTLRSVINFSENSILNVGSGIVYTFGNIGVIMFVICSSYFLADKEKINFKRIINILLDSTIISSIILIIFLLCNIRIEMNILIKQLFPDIFALVWFIPCYIIFYVLSPVISAGLKKIGKKNHLILIIFLLIVYGFLSVLGYPPIGSRLFQFIYIYIITTYVKWYPLKIFEKKKKCLFLFISLLLLNYIFHFIFYYLKMYSNIFENVDFFSFYSPFLIISLLALFFFFYNYEFSNRFISYLSSCSLFVYVIHENFLLRTYTRVWYYEYFTDFWGINNALYLMCFLGLFMFVVGFLIAILYEKTIHRLTEKIADFILIVILKMVLKLERKEKEL